MIILCVCIYIYKNHFFTGIHLEGFALRTTFGQGLDPGLPMSCQGSWGLLYGTAAAVLVFVLKAHSRHSVLFHNGVQKP